MHPVLGYGSGKGQSIILQGQNSLRDRCSWLWGGTGGQQLHIEEHLAPLWEASGAWQVRAGWGGTGSLDARVGLGAQMPGFSPALGQEMQVRAQSDL